MTGSPIRPSPIRPDIAALQPAGLARIFDLGRGVEGLIPLWLGETDLVTPKFIRDAAAAALEDGKTSISTPAACRRCARPSPACTSAPPAWRWLPPG
jgi:aspartate/methionine/tyrosine aminotransferase